MNTDAAQRICKTGAMTTATVHLVRHGEVYNPDRVLYGRLTGFHLSALGYRMAEELADWFAQPSEAMGDPPQILVSSPLLRAQETIAPLAQRIGQRVRTEERVIEAANRFEGISNVKRQLRHPRTWGMLHNPFRPSWGEPYINQAARMAAAVHDVRDELIRDYGDGAQGVIVGHQLPIWVTRLSAEGKPLWHDPRDRECSLTSVTSLHFDVGESRPRVEYQEPNKHLLADATGLPGA